MNRQCICHKTFCIDIAPSEDLVREHARRAAVPADPIIAAVSVIDPTAGDD